VTTLLALALAPGAALFLFFYFRDRCREPLFPLIITFLLGAAALLPAVLLSLLLQRVTGLSSRAGSILELFLTALFIAGLVEESCKFAVVRLFSWNRREFDEPYDGIMYAVAASLGFATVENIFYVLGHGVGTGVMRALLAVPAHAFFGVLMGFFLGEARFAAGRARAAALTLAGLGLAILAHGVYNFIVFTIGQRPLMLLVLPVFAALSWAVFFEATRRQRDKSPRIRADLAELHERPVAAQETPGAGGGEPDEGVAPERTATDERG